MKLIGIFKKTFIATLISIIFINNLNIISANALLERPEIQSQSAIVMNADTKEILYEKNIHLRCYPASITKIMTALLVIENTNLDSKLTFSQNAVTGLEKGAVTLGAKAGDSISVRAALYGLLLKSANEIANALAEYTSSSIENFAKIMNIRARQIGAYDTNFVNPSGLNDLNHYTTAYDMALITKVAFDNPEFREIERHTTYEFPRLGANEERIISMGHKMLHKNDPNYYDGIIGGKTGYTKAAQNTLVTVVQRGDLRLIAVVLKSPKTHYQDTKKILDYAFSLKEKQDFDKNNSKKNVQLIGPGQMLQISGLNFGWNKDERGWRYLKSDNTLAINEILSVNGYNYWFDNNTYMATGWRKDKIGIWYYMKESGEMKKSSWILYKGLWYYVDENGKMLTNTISPDGYKLNEFGVWIN